MAQLLTKLMTSIEYHHKALNCCTQKFPYRTNIKSSLAEENAQLGHYYYHISDYENAIRLYLAARKQDPDHFPALNQLAISYVKLGRFDDALFHLKNIVDRAVQPHDFSHKEDAIHNISWVRKVRQETEESLKILLNLCAKNSWKEAYAMLLKLHTVTPMAHYVLEAEKVIKDAITTDAFVSSHHTLFEPSKTRHAKIEHQEKRDLAHSIL